MKTIVVLGANQHAYPKLMNHVSRDVIILFSDEYTGVVIHSTDSDYPLGLMATYRSKKDTFEYFTGSLTLSN